MSTEDVIPPAAQDSAARQRTRRAVLEAAVSVWSRDFGASLGEIAERAGVSRSTLHRYFPDRQGLLAASATDALRRLEAAYVEATAHCATATAELEAGLRASVRQGDAMIFLFTDPARFAENPLGDGVEYDAESLALVERAQAEGGVAPDMSPQWVISVYYSLAYVAAEAIHAGTMSPLVAEDMALRTFRSGCVAT